MTLDELLAMHTLVPSLRTPPAAPAIECWCGRAYETEEQWTAHLSEVIRAQFVLVARPTPVLGEGDVLLSPTGHLAFVTFPFADDDATTVKRESLVLADAIRKAF